MTLTAETPLEDALWDVIQPNSGLSESSVIWDSDSGEGEIQPPDLPYLVITSKGFCPVCLPELGPIDDMGLQEVTQHYYWDVVLSAYGPGSPDVIKKVLFSFNKETVMEALEAGGLSLMDTGDQSRMTYVKDGARIERSIAKLRLGFQDSDTDNVGLIETVTMSTEAGTGSAASPLINSVTITS